jgi:hypothetical protein
MNVATANELARQFPDLTAQYSETMRDVLARSATDAEFRSRLIADSRTTLREVTGLDASAVKIAFVENKADVTIVLPNFVDEAAPLSDVDLEAVAGGTDPCVGGIILSICLIAGATIEALRK